MSSFAPSPGGVVTFAWLRTGARPVEFSLTAEGRPVAVLRWPASGSSPVSVTTPDATWTLERSGFLTPRIALRTDPGSPPTTKLTGHLSQHLLELADGATYRVHRAGLLVPAWTISASDGSELAHIEPVAEGRRLVAGAVVVPAEAAGRAGLVPAIVVAWYFIALMWFEDEAVETLAPLEGSGGPVGTSGPA